ncbi:hypothetical protein PNA2_0947 [Pyrococcus sp. NA2]|uniref:hypothetical protein n=1 Tax=Pyrococcus sp. (strain NA2) TaxID=342949 RepID=UPI000209A91A|nr:hypothetical protein [Pyrococcus sp. NA2]AEC51863.1 hypothetical protein PNA2_0947 [Pyrococcus sp. NA2]
MLREITILAVIYMIIDLLTSIRPILDFVDLGLRILGIAMSSKTFILLIFGMIGIGLILSEVSLVAISSVPFILYSFIWVAQSSPLLQEINPVFTAFFGGISELKVLLSSLLLVISFVVETHERYKNLGLRERESFVIPAFLVFLAFLLSLFIRDLTLPFVLSLSWVLALLLIISLAFSLISHEKISRVHTVIRVVCGEKSQIEVKGKVAKIISRGEREDVKVFEVEGEIEEVYIVEGNMVRRIPKVIESFDSEKKFILYSNDNIIKL